MYKIIALKIVDIMNNGNSELDDPDLKEISKYGIEITLSTLFNYIMIFLIGIFFRTITSVIIFSIVFNSLRKYIGGYHCTTYFRCNVTFCIIFIMVLLLSKFTYKAIGISLMIMFLLFSGYGIWYWGPVENHYKPVSAEQQKHCHAIAKIIYGVDSLLAIVCYIWLPYYAMVAVYSILAVVILLPIGTVAERRPAMKSQ